MLYVWPERKAAFCPWATTSRSKQGDRETTQLCSQGPLCPLVSFSTCTPNIRNQSIRMASCVLQDQYGLILSRDYGLYDVFFLSNLIYFMYVWFKKENICQCFQWTNIWQWAEYQTDSRLNKITKINLQLICFLNFGIPSCLSWIRAKQIQRKDLLNFQQVENKHCHPFGLEKFHQKKATRKWLSFKL